MSEFRQDEYETPVLFRRPRGKQLFELDGVTAVFPCEPGDSEYNMTCYAHVGQHSACDLGWYNTTRQAMPAEYAALKRELESAPYGYRLKVMQRMPADALAKRRKVLEAMGR